MQRPFSPLRPIISLTTPLTKITKRPSLRVTTISQMPIPITVQSQIPTSKSLSLSIVPFPRRSLASTSL